MSAFSDIRVLDFSRAFPAAMAAMHLADFGAEVIRIDADLDERARGAPGFLAWNRNKKVLALDLADSGDLIRAKALIADADVAIFDGPPGAAERAGLGGQDLLAAHPRLICAWAPPLAAHGPLSALPGAHNLLAGLTGIAFRQASYAGSPVHLVTPQALYGQANCLAAAIAAALLERERSGRGQQVVVTGLHGAAQVNAATHIPNAPPYVLWSKPLVGAPNYRLYECGDGEYFFLGALFEAFYMRALDAIGLLADLLVAPGVEGDLGLALSPEGAPTTMAMLEAKFRSAPRAHWLAVLQEADVPCAPVGGRAAWFAGETIVANQMRVTLEHPELGAAAMPGIAAHLSATPGAVRHLAQPIEPGAIRARGPAPPAGKRARAAPLARIKVLDLGAVIAAPYAAAMLASFGADVVKVEPLTGDGFRPSTVSFTAYNRGKRGLALDLKHPEGKAAFLDMVRAADVVIDNYRRGVRERLGLGYDVLRQINPRLISLSITGYGQSGPQAHLPGFDPLMQAQSGLMQAQGGAGGEPVFHQLAVNDVGAAAMSAFAIIAALNARERMGEGQEIHTSLAGLSVMLQIGELTSYPGAPAPLDGARDCIGASALERYYACADGWIGLACRDRQAYLALARALALTEGPAAALAAPRDGPLAEAIAAALKRLARSDALSRLNAAGAPAAPVLTADEMFRAPLLEEMFETYRHPVFGAIKGVRGFADFAQTPAGYARPAPGLGEHSLEVLRAYGVAEERIAALIRAGAVVQG